MKIKLLVAACFFIPALVMAEGTPKIEAPVVVGIPSAGIPGANGGGVAKPAAAPVAVKPAPVQFKPAADSNKGWPCDDCIPRDDPYPIMPGPPKSPK